MESELIPPIKEEQAVNLIGALNQLFRVEAHLAEKRRLYQEAGREPDAGLFQFYELREDFLTQIFAEGQRLPVQSAAFQEMLLERTPDEGGNDRAAYLHRLESYQQIEGGEMVVSLLQAVRRLQLRNAIPADPPLASQPEIQEAKRLLLRALLEVGNLSPNQESLIQDLLPPEQLSAYLETIHRYQQKIQLALTG